MRQPRKYVRPIILVPHGEKYLRQFLYPTYWYSIGMTAILSMYNVKEFLESGNYIFPEKIYKSNPTREVRMVRRHSRENEF